MGIRNQTDTTAVLSLTVTDIITMWFCMVLLAVMMVILMLVFIQRIRHIRIMAVRVPIITTIIIRQLTPTLMLLHIMRAVLVE